MSPSSSPSIDTATALQQLEKAVREELISASACEYIRAWLTEPRYADYEASVRLHIESQQWNKLDDVFWKIIPFGTGGRRGRMYPIGCNAINDRTIGESAQGLADYVAAHRQDEGELACAIAYDTRHRSWEFTQLCSEIMVAAGYKVYLLDSVRSTPELSFMVRYKGCSCGIMVTASHNPPSDNAVKVYESTGCQVLPPHDKGVIECVTETTDIRRANFQEALEQGKIEICTEEVDQHFQEAVLRQNLPGPRDIKIIYSPLHGVGESAVMPVLYEAGFSDCEVYAEHREQNGDFPNVPNHVANPENPAVFTPIIDRARSIGADLILATDPDCDRLGCAAAIDETSGPWAPFNGNQIASLLADFVLQNRQDSGKLSGDDYLVKTLVTTEMVRRIGDSYGVQTHGNLHVGFKWIGQEIDIAGPEHFLFGCEESHGYLVGTHCRDKDAAVASMLMSSLAAQLKSQGLTLHQHIEQLYRRHGYHAERLKNTMMEGSAGMEIMRELMHRFRNAPPTEIGGIPVESVRDYLNLQTIRGGERTPLDAPQGDMVIIDLAEPGNYVAARPSGTEPKIKFYMFTYLPADQIGDDLDQAREAMNNRLNAFEHDLTAFAHSMGTTEE